MKKIIYACIAWLLITLPACNHATKTQTSVNEFEGVITYKTRYTSWNDGDTAKPSTDTVRIYYSHGNLVKLHSADNPTGIKKEIFLLKGHRYYCTKFGIDSIWWLDNTPSKDMTLADMEVIKAEKPILGHDCEEVHLTVKDTHNKDQAFIVENSYIFSRGYLQVNKANLNWYKIGFFDKFIDESGCFYLGFKSALHYKTGSKILFTKEYEAIDVKEEKVDTTVFNLDKSLPLKEFNL